jgi:hypothetical protein
MEYKRRVSTSSFSVSASRFDVQTPISITVILTKITARSRKRSGYECLEEDGSQYQLKGRSEESAIAFKGAILNRLDEAHQIPITVGLIRISRAAARPSSQTRKQTRLSNIPRFSPIIGRSGRLRTSGHNPTHACLCLDWFPKSGKGGGEVKEARDPDPDARSWWSNLKSRICYSMVRTFGWWERREQLQTASTRTRCTLSCICPQSSELENARRAG